MGITPSMDSPRTDSYWYRNHDGACWIHASNEAAPFEPIGDRGCRRPRSSRPVSFDAYHIRPVTRSVVTATLHEGPEGNRGGNAATPR